MKRLYFGDIGAVLSALASVFDAANSPVPEAVANAAMRSAVRRHASSYGLNDKYRGRGTGNKAAERYRRHMAAGRIPESQILRGVA